MEYPPFAENAKDASPADSLQEPITVLCTSRLESIVLFVGIATEPKSSMDQQPNKMVRAHHAQEDNRRPEIVCVGELRE
jgi:hypothetical protein